MQSVWLEVALNGPWGQRRQPLIPVRVHDIIAQGIACAHEGAAIIHVHAYDEESGIQNDDWQIYARIIEGIRKSCDVIVYPTIPLAGSSYAAKHTEQRFNHIHELAQRGLIDMTVLDPGSVNFVRYDQMADITQGFIYMNPTQDIRAGMVLATTYRLAPGYAIYEPGFTRLGAALVQEVKLTTGPVYRVMFSDEFAWGFPPKVSFLDAHLLQLAECAGKADWMIAGLGVDIRPLIPAALTRGGHVRVGLEDAPWGSDVDNAGWTKQAVEIIGKHGCRPATAAEVRTRLELI